MAFQVGGAGSGASGIVRFEAPLPITATGVYSAIWRVKFSGTPSADGALSFIGRDSNDTDSVQVDGLDATKLYLRSGNGTANADVLTASGVLPVGVWVEIAQVRESDTSLKLYVDGVLVATNTQDIGSRNTATIACFGGFSTGSVMTGTPSIADIIMWDSIALTAGEVALEVGPDPVKAGATAYFPYRQTSARDANGHSVDQIGSFTPLAAGPEVYTSDLGLPTNPSGSGQLSMSLSIGL